MIQRSDLYNGSEPQTGSGYKIWEGLYLGEHIKISSSNYPTNSFDGSLKHLIWRSIDRNFYKFPFDPIATLEHTNRRYCSKFLNYSASIFAIPYLDMGEKVKVGSLQITSSNFNLTDDQNGNIYDVSLNTGSYSNKYNLVGYWGFNDELRKCKNIPHTFEKTKINFHSSVFEPEGSIAKNISLVAGVPLNNTGSGLSCYFYNSVILTENRNEFNFTKDDDFTISFWLKYEPNGSDAINTIISKNTLITEQTYGLLDHYNQNDQIEKVYHVSSSTAYKPIDIYPYRFEVNTSTGLLTFRRSDGTNSCNLSGSIDLDDGKWHHYATVKSGSNLYLYQDGTIVQSGSEVKYNPHNNYNILFGNDGLESTNSFLGNLDEIRFYNKGLSTSTIQTLCDSSSLGMYQSSIVGNIFYRSGNVVISSLDPKYNKVFERDFTLKYEGTHRIYEYETLVRIPKGSFNLTYNPTARKGPFTDLLIDEMSGSLETGGLYPYFHTVGLYNSNNELLAVGKLNQPIMSRPDVDINIIVQWHG